MGILLAILLQFTSFNDGSKLLSGNWQSCKGDDGEYSERIFDYQLAGKYVWSFHFGPKDQFALFTDPNSDAHDSADNLLFPNHVVEEGAIGEWNISNKLLNLRTKGHLHIRVVVAGGSRDECESYFVEIEPKP